LLCLTSSGRGHDASVQEQSIEAGLLTGKFLDGGFDRRQVREIDDQAAKRTTRLGNALLYGINSSIGTFL
jgi:hypothetical protein